MALQEVILSSSSTLTCLHDLKTGSLLTSFKGAATNVGADFSSESHQQGSSSSAYGRSTADSKGKARAVEDDQSFLFRKTTDTVETKDGMGGIVASVIAGKAAINVWSFQKEAPLHRLLTPVKISCLALSKNGTYLACGGHDGRILLWEIASGALVASFDAHYRAVTCLAWTDDDAAFISGGDDSACHVWSLPIVLASAASTLAPVSAYTSLTDHTLPITSIDISFGSFPRVRVLTSALDGSCKIWDLTLRGSTLLSTFDFSSLGTTRVTNAVWDTLERTFYAVLAFTRKPLSQTAQTPGRMSDSFGRVVKVDLYRQVRAGESLPLDDDIHESKEQNMSGNNDPEETRSTRWTAVGGGGRGDITHVTESEANSLGRFFETRGDYISSVHLSHLSSHLLVGTQKGRVHILSLPSLQSIRTIVPSQTSAMASMSSPVTFLRAMIRPIDLISRTGSSSGGVGGSGNKANEAEILPRPVAAQLSRGILQPGSKEAEERVVQIRLTGGRGSKGSRGSPFAIDEIVLPPREARANRKHRLTQLGFGDVAALSTTGPSGNDAQSLQEENARLREQLARSIALNDKMWESVVDSTLAKAKESMQDGKHDHQALNGAHDDVDMS